MLLRRQDRFSSVQFSFHMDTVASRRQRTTATSTSPTTEPIPTTDGRFSQVTSSHHGRRNFLHQSRWVYGSERLRLKSAGSWEWWGCWDQKPRASVFLWVLESGLPGFWWGAFLMSGRICIRAREGFREFRGAPPPSPLHILGIFPGPTIVYGRPDLNNQSPKIRTACFQAHSYTLNFTWLDFGGVRF